MLLKARAKHRIRLIAMDAIINSLFDIVISILSTQVHGFLCRVGAFQEVAEGILIHLLVVVLRFLQDYKHNNSNYLSSEEISSNRCMHASL